MYLISLQIAVIICDHVLKRRCKNNTETRSTTQILIKHCYFLCDISFLKKQD